MVFRIFFRAFVFSYMFWLSVQRQTNLEDLLTLNISSFQFIESMLSDIQVELVTWHTLMCEISSLSHHSFVWHLLCSAWFYWFPLRNNFHTFNMVALLIASLHCFLGFIFFCFFYPCFIWEFSLKVAFYSLLVFHTAFGYNFAKWYLPLCCRHVLIFW